MADQDQALRAAYQTITSQWDSEIIPELVEYIKIPCKSPGFDPDWKKNGYLHAAMQQMRTWAEKQNIKDMTLEWIEEGERTPLLYMEIPGELEGNVLLYGHMDKQPEMIGWDDDKGPWKPVMQDGKLYGRGAADDGYAIYSALSAIAALQQQNLPHPRCVVLIEASEESGSFDLPYYLESLKPRIGDVNLVICLDSGAGDYERLWSTTSLRGIVNGTLSIRILEEGLHSGMASGIVPSAFMILRQLLDRIEDAKNGHILPEGMKAAIPQARIEQSAHTADILKDSLNDGFPFVGETRPACDSTQELILNNNWRAALSVTGIEGLPPLKDAGNVTVPEIKVSLSFRLPPDLDPDAAIEVLKETLETDPPFGAEVHYEATDKGPGWQAPAVAKWLDTITHEASQLFFEKPAAYRGEGASIPFMGMLGEVFPQAQFLITGVLGPRSNAHGPNEFLHIEKAKRITGCVAAVLTKMQEKR